MQLLVTGHLGYIGTVLTPLLARHGFTVRGWDADLFAASTFSPLPPSIPAQQRDIRAIQADDLEGMHAVIHLAGLANDPLGDLDPEQTDAINRAAAVRLAKIARAAGVERFLLASTCSVYGAAGTEWVDERSLCRPVTAYARSKLRAEQEIGALSRPGFCPTFLRLATLYGASPRLRFDLVVNNLTAWAYTTGFVQLKSDGAAWRPLLHVEDLARAFVAVLEAPTASVCNQIFNVGSSQENYQIREVAEIVARTVPGAQLRFAPDATTDPRSYRVNFQKLHGSLPAFQPQWTVTTGVRQLLQAFEQQRLAAQEFESARFSRVDHVRVLLRTGKLDRTLRWIA